MLVLTFVALAVYGWALVIARLKGPWQACERIRARWPGGPWACPACVGWWAGALAAALYLAAQQYPAAAAVAVLLGGPGAGAGVAWIGVHAAEALRRAGELSAQQAWTIRRAQAGTEKGNNDGTS